MSYLNFCIIVGMYYLCDVAYTHTRGFMCPYKGTRYWLSDFSRDGQARDKKEKFNHAHARLRNVIERTFGVLKNRFAILHRMAPYSYRTQVHIVVACMAIHNFLRRVSLNDPLFQIYEDDDVDLPAEPSVDSEQAEAPPNYDQIFRRTPQQEIINLRDKIADQLFSRIYD